jgi:sugar transferase (PEP-CTERM/EpsH1 system associated)
MAIRVMHIVEALGVGGGVEQGIANLIERMDPRLVEHVLCSVFRLGPRMERYPADRVRVICLNQKSRTQVLPLARVIREVRPAIVHSRNWGTLDAVVAARCVRFCSVIHSEHGLEAHPSADPKRRGWLRRVAFELADQVFCVSSRLRDSLAGQTGFPARKIRVIHNGVDLDRFRRDCSARQRVRRELGVADGELCIGCVGRLNRVKDYATMLQAATLFAASNDRWRLMIAGSGSDFDALQAIVNTSQPLQGRVRFLGDVRGISEFLSALDVYVLPSLWEGISNSLLEAMAAGLPVIASDIGGNPEVVVDGKSGFLFPVGDARRLADRLDLLYRQPDLRERIGAQAAVRVHQEFALPAMVRQYEELYSALA